MSDGHEYHRGRWEGDIEARVSDLEEGLEAANRERKELAQVVQDLNKALDTFNAANKEREAVSMAVADALNKVSKRWYDRWVLLAAAGSAIFAGLSASGIFH